MHKYIIIVYDGMKNKVASGCTECKGYKNQEDETVYIPATVMGTITPIQIPSANFRIMLATNSYSTLHSSELGGIAMLSQICKPDITTHCSNLEVRVRKKAAKF